MRFLHLSQAVSGDIDTRLDLTALRLLEIVASAHATSAPMTVSDTMKLRYIASPATLHRKIDQLRDAGFITQVFEGTNRRTKYLVPTSSADKYFDQLGKAMVTAQQGT